MPPKILPSRLFYLFSYSNFKCKHCAFKISFKSFCALQPPFSRLHQVSVTNFVIHLFQERNNMSQFEIFLVVLILFESVLLWTSHTRSLMPTKPEPAFPKYPIYTNPPDLLYLQYQLLPEDSILPVPI